MCVSALLAAAEHTLAGELQRQAQGITNLSQVAAINGGRRACTTAAGLRACQPQSQRARPLSLCGPSDGWARAASRICASSLRAYRVLSAQVLVSKRRKQAAQVGAATASVHWQADQAQAAMASLAVSFPEPTRKLHVQCKVCAGTAAGEASLPDVDVVCCAGAAALGQQ